MSFTSCFQRISEDFCQKKLLLLKLLFFIQCSANYALFPFLTLHMHQLGMNVTETAIISGMLPIITLCTPYLVELLTTKIKDLKIFLTILSGLGGISVLLFMVVPVARTTITNSNPLVFGVSCQQNYPLRFSMAQDYLCTPRDSEIHEAEMEMKSCGIVCLAANENNDRYAILNVASYGIQFRDSTTNAVTTITYQTDPKNKTSDSNYTRHIKLQNDKDDFRTIRKLSKHSYYFPTPSLFNFSCQISANLNSTKQILLNSMLLSNIDQYSCVFGKKDQLQKLKTAIRTKFRAGVFASKPNKDDVAEERRLYNLMYIKTNTTLRKTICLKGFPKRDFVSVNLQYSNKIKQNRNMDLGSCAPRCLATTERKYICSNNKETYEENVFISCGVYFLVRVLSGILCGTGILMFDYVINIILKQHRADCDLQKVYGIVGKMISSPMAGWIIDAVSNGKGLDYKAIFWLYASLKIISTVLIQFLNLSFKVTLLPKPRGKSSILQPKEFIVLMIVCFILGGGWGYTENFHFWFIQDLGGSNLLMGLTLTISGVFSIPLLIFSWSIIENIGYANVISIGLICFAIRLVGYSFVFNPWVCLILEAMDSVTSLLSFTSAIMYAAKLLSHTSSSRSNWLINGIYFGIGKGAGSLIGGYFIQEFGFRSTYRIFATLTAFTGIAYFLFNYFYLGHQLPRRDNPRQTSFNIQAIVDKTDLESVKKYEVNRAITCPPFDNVIKFENSESKFELTTNIL